MKLGNFSIDLTVKDIRDSKTFYEKLGFKVFTDDVAREIRQRFGSASGEVQNIKEIKK